jgi:hypothetical protein
MPPCLVMAASVRTRPIAIRIRRRLEKDLMPGLVHIRRRRCRLLRPAIKHGVHGGHTKFHGAYRGQHLDRLIGIPGRFRRFARSANLPFSVELRVTFVNSVFYLIADGEADTAPSRVAEQSQPDAPSRAQRHISPCRTGARSSSACESKRGPDCAQGQCFVPAATLSCCVWL